MHEYQPLAANPTRPFDLKTSGHLKIICSCGCYFQTTLYTTLSPGFSYGQSTIPSSSDSSMEISRVPSSQPPACPAYMPQMYCHRFGLQNPQALLPGQGFKFLSKMRGCVQGSMGRTGPQPWLLNPLRTGHQAQHPGVSGRLAWPESQEKGFQLVPTSPQHLNHRPSRGQSLISPRSAVLSRQTHSLLLLQASFPPPP